VIARRLAVLIPAMIFIAPVKLGAQENWPVELHDRVRITLKRDHSAVIGTVQTIEAHALVIERKRSGLRTIALRDMKKLEISRGERTGALKGAIGGFAIFGLAGTLTWGAACEADFGLSASTSSREPCTGEAALVGLGAGAVGALLGAVIGSAIRTDRWDEAPLDFYIGPASVREDDFVVSASVSTDFLKATIGL